MMPLFPKDEYLERLRKTKVCMAAAGIDVIVVSDPANMNYLTGYDGWSFYVHQGVIISLDMENPFWFGREQDAKGAELTSWLPHDCIYGYPDEYVQSRYTHTMRWLVDLLRERDLDKEFFGVEMDGYWFNARMYTTLLKELPQVKLMDGTNLVNWVRAVKSPAEIEYMQQAARICEGVMQIAVDEIDTGVWEKDVAAKVCAAQIAGTDEFGGSSPAIFPIMHISVPENNGDVDIKAAYVRGLKSFAVKMGAGFFDNRRLGLPSSPAMMVVISAHTRFAEAVLLDNAYLTDVRTGAAGAVAAKHLAPAKVYTASVIGTGVDGRMPPKALVFYTISAYFGV